MKLFQLLIVTFLILVNPINNVFSQDVTLSWDPSPTSEVTGYNVYYKQGDSDLPFDGTSATEGTSPIDVGDTLTTTLTNLNDDVNYFFSVTAYSTDAESSFSNIVCSGGGGSGESASNHSAAGGSEPSELYSINKDTSDYHQAYNLEPSTTYYWKVVATDTQDPDLTYESEVRQFTTEDF